MEYTIGLLTRQIVVPIIGDDACTTENLISDKSKKRCRAKYEYTNRTRSNQV